MLPTLERLEQLVRAGRGQDVAETLRSLSLQKLPRPEAIRYAALCRRTEQPELGLRLLGRWVRSYALNDVPTPREIAEYSACLIRAGAVREALDRLRAVDSTKTPEALLYQAFALAESWDHAQMIPLLTAYLKTPGLPRYQALIAKSNLIASYIFIGEDRTVTALLREAVHDASLRNHRLIRGSLFELGALAAIQRHGWSRAETCLEEAARCLVGSASLESFFVKKWRGILEAARHGNIARFAELRKEAESLRHWETLRDLDRW